MSSLPTFGIVIPAWNAARWIDETLQSVSAQTVRPSRVIVVDDGSTDDTCRIVSRYPGVELIQQENAGAATARNTGFASMDTDLVQFLDADDLIGDRFVEGACKRFSETQYDIAFSPLIVMRLDGRRQRIFHYDSPPPPSQIFDKWGFLLSQPPCSVVWRSAFVQMIGGWSSEKNPNDDGEIVMRAMLFDPKVAGFLTGEGYWRETSAPSLSKLRSSVGYRNDMAAMVNLADLAKGRGLDYALSSVTGRLYLDARAGFEIGDLELGREALAHARRLGLRGHPGAPAHTLLASVFGLERKTRLADFIRCAASHSGIK